MFKLIIISFISVSYFFIDAPLVLFIHKYELNKSFILEILTHIPDVIIALLLIYFLLFLIIYKKWNRYKFFNVSFIALISVAISVQIKDLLKYVFGRTWPDTWKNGNPSLIVNNEYGFHFFRSGSAYSSFPSGHATVTFAFFTVLIFFYPKYKKYFYVPLFLLCLGQVFKYYHFLSDVLAGAFLGWGISTIICQYYLIRNKNKI